MQVLAYYMSYSAMIAIIGSFIGSILEKLVDENSIGVTGTIAFSRT